MKLVQIVADGESVVPVCGSRLCAQAWERRLVLGVDGGAASWGTSWSSSTGWSITATTAATSSTVTPAEWTLATATTSTATVTTSSATSSAVAAGLWGLDEALVDLKDLLLLALTLTLGLAGRGGNKVLLLLLLDLLGVGPLLVLLAALVGLAKLESAVVKSGLLLSLLNKVIGVRDAVVLGLRISGLQLLAISVNWCRVAIAGKGFLLLSLGNGLACLLIVELGVTLGSTPSMGGLLVRVAGASLEAFSSYQRGVMWLTLRRRGCGDRLHGEVHGHHGHGRDPRKYPGILGGGQCEPRHRLACRGCWHCQPGGRGKLQHHVSRVATNTTCIRP